MATPHLPDKRAPTQERSIALETTVHADFEQDDPITYREVPAATQRGKPILVDNRGYSYTLWRTAGDKLTWRCTKRSKTLTCPATVIQNSTSYKEGRKEHAHDPEPGAFNKITITSEVNAMDDYYEVLRAIDRYLGGRIALQRVVVDFEAGLWKAVRERFPNVEIQGCAFHWSQAVYRKTQEFGLQNAFYQRGDVHSFVRQLMALHFLPPEHIPGAFRSLRRQAGTEQLQRLMDYIDRQWISSRIFPVESWSTYQVSIRTNNDVEGWHNRLNTRCNTRGPVPFYLLLEELFNESQDIPLQMRMLTEGKVRRYQRKNSRLAQARVFKLWTMYEKGDMSTSQLLRRASKLLD